MKILAINGSNRGETGFTNKCIEKIFEGAAGSGATCEIVSLSEKKINDCIVCNKCLEPDHYLKCIYHDKDDMSAIAEKMKEADLIIFATPVYIFNMSGLLKKFMDRYYSYGNSQIPTVTNTGLFFHHILHEYFSKPIVLFVCGNNFEYAAYKNIVEYFKTYSRFLESPLVGTLVRRSVKLMENSDPGNPKINGIYSALVDSGKELALYKKIKLSTGKRVAQSILPIPPVLSLFRNFRFFKKAMIARAMNQKQSAVPD